MSKRKSSIKVGVIGYGGAFNMGRQHLNEMKAAGMTPTAVVEVDPSRLAAASEDFPGIETHGSVGDMLRKSRVDLVTIITPHNTHAPRPGHPGADPVAAQAFKDELGNRLDALNIGVGSRVVGQPLPDAPRAFSI